MGYEFRLKQVLMNSLANLPGDDDLPQMKSHDEKARTDGYLTVRGSSSIRVIIEVKPGQGHMYHKSPGRDSCLCSSKTAVHSLSRITFE